MVVIAHQKLYIICQVKLKEIAPSQMALNAMPGLQKRVSKRWRWSFLKQSAADLDMIFFF